METRKSKKNLLVKEILNNIKNPALINSDDFFSHVSLSDDENIDSHQLTLQIYNHIISLRLLIDHYHNIQSTLFTSNTGKKIYIRCGEIGSMLEPQEKKLAVYNYLRIFYAYLLAAIVISRIHEFDGVNFAKGISHINKITTDAFYENLSDDNDETMFRYLAEGKGYLINLIQVYCNHLDPVNINFMIDQVKDWVALDEPSAYVCTVIKTDKAYDNKLIIILDEPCSQLLPKQTESFLNLSTQDWFNELSSFQKSLVEYYKKKILSGLSVIPSRLRSVIPLNKNAYEETVWVASSPDEFELINTCYHSGTVAFLNHKDEKIAINMTRLNLLQQKRACNADAMVMICLNSEKADTFLGWYEWFNNREFTPDDSEILKLTQAGALELEEENIFYSKICLNGFRVLEYDDYLGINKIVSIVQENLSGLDQGMSLIVQINDNISTLFNLEKQYILIDYAVKGLDIIHRLTRIASLNNKLVDEYPEKNLKSIAIWFGCASGENRTGITFNHNIGSSIANYFPENSIEKIHHTLAQTQHLHVMTGYQGNTFGTDGIRSKSSGSLKDYHPGRLLITKTSDIKFIPAYDAGYNALARRLSAGINSRKMNAAYKYLLPLVTQCSEFLTSKDKDIVILPGKIKNIYIELAQALEEIMLGLNLRDNLSILQNIQLILSDNKNLNGENTGMLNNLLVKMINVISNLNNSVSEQLVQHGLFKSENPENLPVAQSANSSPVSNTGFN